MPRTVSKTFIYYNLRDLLMDEGVVSRALQDTVTKICDMGVAWAKAPNVAGPTATAKRKSAPSPAGSGSSTGAGTVGGSSGGGGASFGGAGKM